MASATHAAPAPTSGASGKVWAAANVKLSVITIDTDTTVHTLYGQQMGGRKSYNPKNKGKKRYQRMSYVQRRLAYSVGVNPTRTKVRVL